MNDTATAACDLDAPDAASAGPGGAEAWIDHNLRLNDILTVGTHNSYHLRAHPEVMAIMQRAAPDRWWHLDYAHPPLVDQLNDGARGLELDVVYDPEGGRYAHPMGLTHAGLAEDPAYVAAMSRPGFKVLHIQDLDYRSSVLTYVEGLTIIRDWSRAHPRHTPILITMNTNTSKSRTRGGVDALPFDAAAFDALDAEIRSVFGPEQLITPDAVRGDHPTVRDGALAGGWPRLGAARGRVLLAIDETEARVAAYRGDRRSLDGRACFVNVDETSPMAAYITLNEQADAPRIKAAAEAGFLVRTRADAETAEARSGDTTRRDAMLASGAQYVWTDYRHPEPGLTDYQVRLPDGAIALANPVRAAARCAGIPVE
jgi:hypothetical protein